MTHELETRLAGLALPAEDIPAAAAALMREVELLLPADRSTLYLLDEASMSLRSEYASGIDRQIVVPLRIGVIGTAILQRRVVVVPDAQRHPFFYPDIDTSLGFHTRSLLVAPMLNGQGGAMGGLELVNKRVGRFTSADGEAAAAAAARLARWSEEGTIYAAGVESECVAMRNELACERASLFQLEERSGRLTALYADGDEGRVLSINMRLGIAGMVAITGNALVLDDAWDDPRFDRSVDTRSGYRTHTMLAVPIRDTLGASRGVIQLINGRNGRFDASQSAVLEQAARWFGARVLTPQDRS